MYNGKSISLKRILWAVLNNPLAADLSYEQAAEWAIDAIKLVGAPLSYVNSVSRPLEIVNHKVGLPDNLVQVRGIRYIWDVDNYDSQSVALTYAQDVYHHAEKCETNLTNSRYDEFTYTLQNNVLQTSVPDGHVQISYKALPVDEEGYPLIPDTEQMKQLMEYYIMFKYLEPLWTMGKVTDKVFEYYNQKKCFYMGAADTSLKLSGNDQLEALGNAVNRLILNTNAHKNFFKQAGQRERFKRYN